MEGEGEGNRGGREGEGVGDGEGGQERGGGGKEEQRERPEQGEDCYNCGKAMKRSNDNNSSLHPNAIINDY